MTLEAEFWPDRDGVAGASQSVCVCCVAVESWEREALDCR